MKNFLDETNRAVENSGHTHEDIIFIGSLKSGHGCTWKEFCTLADFQYDNGYGAQETATDLIIVFTDGCHLKRGEYLGSEWWNIVYPPTVPKNTLPITKLSVHGTNHIGWKTLSDLNRD